MIRRNDHPPFGRVGFRLAVAAGLLLSVAGHGQGRGRGRFRRYPRPYPQAAPATAPAPGQTGTRGFVPEGIDRVAGVTLNKAATLMQDLGDLTGAVYDPITKRLVLIGTRSHAVPGFRPDDLAVALRALSTTVDGTYQPPGVSIDPPIVNGQLTVHYLGGTEDTHFGQVMFEADRLMKCLAQGQDNITHAPLLPNVPGHRTELDLLRDTGGARRPKAWHRYWLRPQSIQVSLSADGRALRFDHATMEVDTEYVPPLAPGESEPAAEAFARHFTDYYDDYARVYPVFQELLNLAKLMGVVNWLHEKGIHPSGWDTIPIPTVATPRTTPLNHVESASRVPGGTLINQIEGGVDFGLVGQTIDYHRRRNWVTHVSPSADALRQAALKPGPGRGLHWSATLDGKDYTCVALTPALARLAERADDAAKH